MKKIFMVAIIAFLAFVPVFAEGVREVQNVVDLTPVKYSYVDPEHPYDAMNYGLFDYQKTSSKSTPRGGEDISLDTEGTYSIYIPEQSQPKDHAVIVLIPDGETAFDFARSEIGMEWIEASHEKGNFAVVFAEPAGGRWNTTLDPENRDEVAFIFDIYRSIKSKNITANAYFSVNKSFVSLVGYGGGADAAAIVASAWPSIWTSTTLVEPTYFNRKAVVSYLESGNYPHIQINEKRGFGSILNGEVGMPMYIVPGAEGKVAEDIAAVWSEVNSYAIENMQNSTGEPENLVVIVSDNDDVDYLASYATGYDRMLGYPGGTVKKSLDWTKFEQHDEYIGDDGLLRRWMVYVPEGLDLAQKHPMVVGLHGSSSAITDFASQSHWTDVADENGFIVLYIQGYPRSEKVGKTAPIPDWQAYVNDIMSDDMQYIKSVVEKVVAEKNVDTERIYLTGQSLGSMMTQALMRTELNTMFAAYAPCGGCMPPQVMYPSDTDTVMPAWFFLGQYDMQDVDFTSYPEQGPMGYNGGAAAEDWAVTQGLDITNRPEPKPENEYAEGKYETYTWLNSKGDPQLKYTVIANCPHTYMAEQAELIWDQFFSHIRRTGDGNIVFF